ELAGQVAAGGAEGEHAGARIELVQRLLLDRVDAEAGAAAVGGEHHRVALALAHEAHAALAVVQLAVARAQVALDAAVVELVPPAARIGHRHAFCSSNLRTVKRISRTSGAQKSRANPALCLSACRNSRGVGNCCHTCGSSVPRWSPQSSTTPSTPGRSARNASASRRARSGRRAPSTETSSVRQD